MTRTREFIKEAMYNGTVCKPEDGSDTKPCYNGPCCTTNSGENCVFPFTYDGITYDKCIEDCEENDDEGWCATEVDSNGIAKVWDRCRHNCYLSSESGFAFAYQHWHISTCSEISF